MRAAAAAGSSPRRKHRQSNTLDSIKLTNPSFKDNNSCVTSVENNKNSIASEETLVNSTKKEDFPVFEEHIDSIETENDNVSKEKNTKENLNEAFHKGFYENAMIKAQQHTLPWFLQDSDLFGVKDERNQEQSEETKPGCNESNIRRQKPQTRRGVFIDMNQARKLTKVGEKVGTKFAMTDGILFSADRKMVITMPSVDAAMAKLSNDKHALESFLWEHKKEGNARLALGAEWKIRANARRWSALEDSKGLIGELEIAMLKQREAIARNKKKYRYEVCVGRNKRPDGFWKKEGRDKKPIYKIMDMLPDTDDQNVVASSSRINNPRFKILSYNLMPQKYFKEQKDLFMYCSSHLLNWSFRSENLLKEVISFGADIICLQGVDQYEKWWQPKMSNAGYDGIFKESTAEHYSFGLATFYRRDIYQLCSSDSLEFRDIMKQSRGTDADDKDDDSDKIIESPLKNNDVALVCTLQPWETSPHPSAVFVVNTELSRKPPHSVHANDAKSYLRMLQARYLLRRVERWNAHMQLPVLMTGSFHCDSEDPVYHMICTGSLPKILEPPSQPGKPVAFKPTWSSMQVKWEVCKSEGSHSIVGYKIQRRVGKNTSIGFTNDIFIPVDPHEHSDSDSWTDSEEEEMTKLDQLKASYDAEELPRPKANAYFKLCEEKVAIANAVADDAIGAFAKAQSMSIRASLEDKADAVKKAEELSMANLVAQSKKKTELDALEIARQGDPIALAAYVIELNKKVASIPDDPLKRGVKNRAIAELNECKTKLEVLEKFMKKETKRVKQEIKERAEELAARIARGDSVLLEAELAEKKKLDEKRKQKEADIRARRRLREKKKKVKYIEFTAQELASGLVYEYRVAAMSVIGLSKWSEISDPLATAISRRQEKGLCSILSNVDIAGGIIKNVGEKDELDLDLVIGRRDSGLTPRLDDGTKLHGTATNRSMDLMDYFHAKGVALGTLDKLAVHALNLRSAYALYPLGPSHGEFAVGEPSATLITERRREQCDYIFYSAERFVTKRLMMVPGKAFMKELDVREPEMISASEKDKPANWCTEKYILEANYDTGEMNEIPNPLYKGEWKGALVPNPNRTHNYLPNRHISSTHFALCAEIAFSDMTLTSEWY